MPRTGETTEHPTPHTDGPHETDAAASNAGARNAAAIAGSLPAAAVGMAFATAVLAGALRPVAGNNVLFLLAAAWPLIAVAGAPVLGVRPRRAGIITYMALLLGPVSAVAPGLALPWFLWRRDSAAYSGGNSDGTGKGIGNGIGNGNGNGKDTVNGNGDRIRVLGREIPAGAVWAAPVGALLLVFAALRGFAVPVHWALAPALAYVVQQTPRPRPTAAWSIAIAGLAVSPWGLALAALVIYVPLLLVGVWFVARRLFAGSLGLRSVRTAVAGAALFTVLCEWTGGSAPVP
ncbi:hypothetical protein ACPA54_31560 [Uniformispora flossi]|uniref:hypothetical protein n=1 Tax=Uniformispora flossi TaxID=3390723 RepID=UPI003C2FD0A0